MPSPVAHSLAGLLVRAAANEQALRAPWLTTLLLILLANLPDIDFLFGYLHADPGGYHWGATHSLAATLLVGLAAALGARAMRRSFRSWFVVAVAAYGSHLLLDLALGPGAGPSVGLQLFWPLSTERYMAPWSIFRMAPATIATDPLRTLLSRDMLPILGRELVIMLPFVALAVWWARARQSRYDHGKSPTQTSQAAAQRDA